MENLHDILPKFFNEFILILVYRYLNMEMSSLIQQKNSKRIIIFRKQKSNSLQNGLCMHTPYFGLSHNKVTAYNHITLRLLL